MSKLQFIIDQVNKTGHLTLPNPIEIKTHFPFSIFTFTSAWSNGFMLTLANEGGDWRHIEEEEDEDIVDILYNQICEPVTEQTGKNTAPENSDQWLGFIAAKLERMMDNYEIEFDSIQLTELANEIEKSGTTSTVLLDLAKRIREFQ